MIQPVKPGRFRPVALRRHVLQRFRLQPDASMCIMNSKKPQRANVSMNLSLIPIDLQPIAEKVENRQRISDVEALQLYRSHDLNALGIMASAAREQRNGNVATYIHNRYINYSNICVLACQFCAFAAKRRDAHAFEHAVSEIIQAVAEALPLGITEVHMVGGLHPTLKKEWYLDLLRGLL